MMYNNLHKKAPGTKPPGSSSVLSSNKLSELLGKIQAFKFLRSKKNLEVSSLHEMLERLGARTQQILLTNQSQFSFLSQVEAQVEDLKRRMEESINPDDMRSFIFLYEQAVELIKTLETEMEFSCVENLKDSLHKSQVRIEFEKPEGFLSAIGA